MKSKALLTVVFTILSMSMLLFSGNLMAGEDAGKGCPHGAAKVEGKCCEEGMCKKIKEHQAMMNEAAEKMAEHLDAMREIRSDKDWRVEVEKHLAMVQSYVEKLSDCPMGDMWHAMKHGEGHGEKHRHMHGEGQGDGGETK
jgi:hypothetical protein